MNKRETIKQKINLLNQELKKLEEQEKLKVGEFILEIYQKKDFNLDKIKTGIARILGDEIIDELKNKAPELANPAGNNLAAAEFNSKYN